MNGKLIPVLDIFSPDWVKRWKYGVDG